MCIRDSPRLGEDRGDGIFGSGLGGVAKGIRRQGTDQAVSYTHLSCHIREADGEIGFVGILKPQFLTLPFGEFNVYPPFLQIGNERR